MSKRINNYFAPTNLETEVGPLITPSFLVSIGFNPIKISKVVRYKGYGLSVTEILPADGRGWAFSEDINHEVFGLISKKKDLIGVIVKSALNKAKLKIQKAIDLNL